MKDADYLPPGTVGWLQPRYPSFTHRPWLWPMDEHRLGAGGCMECRLTGSQRTAMDIHIRMAWYNRRGRKIPPTCWLLSSEVWLAILRSWHKHSLWWSKQMESLIIHCWLLWEWDPRQIITQKAPRGEHIPRIPISEAKGSEINYYQQCQETQHFDGAHTSNRKETNSLWIHKWN